LGQVPGRSPLPTPVFACRPGVGALLVKYNTVSGDRRSWPRGVTHLYHAQQPRERAIRSDDAKANPPNTSKSGGMPPTEGDICLGDAGVLAHLGRHPSLVHSWLAITLGPLKGSATPGLRPPLTDLRRLGQRDQVSQFGPAI
jgi:hypothetical protein